MYIHTIIYAACKKILFAQFDLHKYHFTQKFLHGNLLDEKANYGTIGCSVLSGRINSSKVDVAFWGCKHQTTNLIDSTKLSC